MQKLLIQHTVEGKNPDLYPGPTTYTYTQSKDCPDHDTLIRIVEWYMAQGFPISDEAHEDMTGQEGIYKSYFLNRTMINIRAYFSTDDSVAADSFKAQFNMAD